MKAANRSNLRLNCAGHNLNLAVEHSLRFPNAEAVCELINTAKECIRYFKQCGHNKDLKHMLKQDVATCWNSQFFMLQSLLTELENVTKF